MILRDSGHRIPWVDFDVRGGINYAAGEQEDEGQGKAPDTSSTTTETLA
jgi:hypothetical protein